MSRWPSSSTTTSVCFPRVSGDEPADGDILITWEKFSPRERG